MTSSPASSVWRTSGAKSSSCSTEMIPLLLRRYWRIISSAGKSPSSTTLPVPRSIEPRAFTSSETAAAQAQRLDTSSAELSAIQVWAYGTVSSNCSTLLPLNFTAFLPTSSTAPSSAAVQCLNGSSMISPVARLKYPALERLGAVSVTISLVGPTKFGSFSPTLARAEASFTLTALLRPGKGTISALPLGLACTLPEELI